MRSQQSVAIQKKGEEGSAGSHVTRYYLKALILSFPLIPRESSVLHPAGEPDFFYCSTRLFTHTVDLCSFSLFNRATQWRTEAEQ